VGYEGPANLLEGIRVAADAGARGMGTMVVLNDEINSAREDTNTLARRLHTFQSRGYGVLGVVDNDRVAWYRRPVKRHAAGSEFDVFAITTLPRVDVLMVYQDAPGDLIKAAVDNGAKGIVMATAGGGATSGTQMDAMLDAAGRQTFVVISTRTGGGRIWPFPAGAAPAMAPEVAARRAFLLAAEDLMPVKARLLLMLGLATTSDREQLQRMFVEY
jgi:L-asparaginase